MQAFSHRLSEPGMPAIHWIVALCGVGPALRRFPEPRSNVPTFAKCAGHSGSGLLFSFAGAVTRLASRDVCSLISRFRGRCGLAFISFTVGVVAKTRTTPVLKNVPKVIERIEQRCTETASEMLCPCHQKNARVVVDGEKLDHLEIEIVCCCDRFANCVRDALQKPLNLR